MWSAASHEGNRCWRVSMVAVGILSLAASVVRAAQPRPAQPYVPNLVVHRDIEYGPGGHERQKLDLYLQIPATFTTPPRALIVWVHGDKDPLVPHNQSEILLDALKKAGVEATLYTVRGGGHGGFKDPQVDILVTEFFRKHLLNR